MGRGVCGSFIKTKNKKGNPDLSIYTRIFRVRSGTMEAVEVVEAVRVFQHRLRNPVDPFKTRKIMLTLQDIEPLVHMPVKRSALSLGISSTTLKKKCRLLGMERWPYSRRGTSFSKSSSNPPLCYPDEGCDLWFLACECSPRCGPLCERTSRPDVDPFLWV